MNLTSEGISQNSIDIVGNTVVDALQYARSKVSGDYRPINPQIAALPKSQKLILTTLHRRENIGEPLRHVLKALQELGKDGDKSIVLPVHLNPQIRGEVLGILGDAPNVFLVDPLQYPDFVHLMSRAWTVVTDSGGIQEEAPTFGLQILITRESTERPECVEAGFGTLVGSDRKSIVDGVRRLTMGSSPNIIKAENPFGDGKASHRIADRLTSKIKQNMMAVG